MLHLNGSETKLFVDSRQRRDAGKPPCEFDRDPEWPLNVDAPRSGDRKEQSSADSLANGEFRP
jgi:hypothetical protein